DLVAAPGQTLTVGVAATGAVPLRYRWLRNGVPVAGTSAELNLPAINRADDGAEFRCVVSNSHGSTRSRRVRLRVLPWQEPVRTSAVLPGLHFRCYEGVWPALPDFAALTPVKTGITPGVELGDRTPDREFACTLEGFLDVEAAGIYT